MLFSETYTAFIKQTQGSKSVLKAHNNNAARAIVMPFVLAIAIRLH
jgi:hypothetical protein